MPERTVALLREAAALAAVLDVQNDAWQIEAAELDSRAERRLHLRTDGLGDQARRDASVRGDTGDNPRP